MVEFLKVTCTWKHKQYKLKSVGVSTPPILEFSVYSHQLFCVIVRPCLNFVANLDLVQGPSSILAFVFFLLLFYSWRVGKTKFRRSFKTRQIGCSYISYPWAVLHTATLLTTYRGFILFVIPPPFALILMDYAAFSVPLTSFVVRITDLRGDIAQTSFHYLELDAERYI